MGRIIRTYGRFWDLWVGFFYEISWLTHFLVDLVDRSGYAIDMEREGLIKAGVGVYCEPRDRLLWNRKYRLYAAEGVIDFFRNRREFHRGGGCNVYDANRRAQEDTDEALLKRGEDGVGISPAAAELVRQPDDRGLFDRGVFSGSLDAEIDPIRDLTWIYNNICIRDVRPEDAPSPGAFAHLKFVQENNDNKIDFLTKVYPRIIPAKSQVENLSKFNDDNRATFDLLDRLSRESQDGSGEVPVL